MADEQQEKAVELEEENTDIKQVEADDDAGEDDAEEAKDKVGSAGPKAKIQELHSPQGSTLTLLSDLNVELDNTQRELLKKVRRSVHIARGNAPNLRLNATVEDEGVSGMKSVDMSALLSIIGEEQVKIEVQKEAAKSKAMVDNISKLLMSEGFL